MSEAAAATDVATAPWLGRTRSFGRRLLGALAVGIALALLAVIAVYEASDRVFERRHAVSGDPTMSLVVPSDAWLLERGRHLVTEVAQCTYCHGPDLAGRELADDPWIGRLYAPNLTRGAGGVGGRLSDADWVAALRRGIASDGRSLLLMPSAGLARLTDRDLAAVVAYVRQVPPVDRVVPARRVGWLTRMVVAAGLAPDLISAEQVAQAERLGTGKAPIEAGPTREYGEYLVAVGGCRVCHRADLGGGLHPLSLPGEPVPPDLTRRGRLAGWTLPEFARAMRQGRTPDGRALDRTFMPWPAFGGLDDLEVEALWRFLATVEAPTT